MSFENQRFVCRLFHIDSNRINARGSLEAMNQIEKLNDDGVIVIEMPNASYNEASFGSSVRAAKANSYPYTLPTNDTPDEYAQRKQIETILFPTGANSDDKRNDVSVVFDALKHGAILITNDGASKRQPGGILGNRDRLKKLGIIIFTDAEAVEYLRNLIYQRDQRILGHCKNEEVPIPEWVGKD